MSSSKTPTTSSSSSTTTINPKDYSHSPVHYAVAVSDHTTLTKLVSSLPKLTDPTQIHTESDSLSQEKLADSISAHLDRRDNRHRETPLHLAVRLNDFHSVRTLSQAGADVSLQNLAGWNPLQEALLRRSNDIVKILVQRHHAAAWSKWRRRLPRVIAVLRRMRDFYMEISFHFESSIVPFVGKIAPSDTYKIWKRDGNLRADTTLAGYDGLKIQRANQSFLFLGDGDSSTSSIPSGSLLVLNHDDKKVMDAFENAMAQLTEGDISRFCSQRSVYRPGMDVTKAELMGRTNWRGQDKVESVGEWKARVYEVHNVVFSFRSKKISSNSSDIVENEQILPLELDEDSEEGFIVCENPRFSTSTSSSSISSGGGLDRRRHSSFVREEREFVTMTRKSVDINVMPDMMKSRRRRGDINVMPPQTKEKEFVKSLRPSVWLTDKFPLKTEELLPLLDILASKVKAVRRMRELLTTTFPPRTFPVKLAIPVVPTVRVVITFTKFVELQPIEQFYTPLSSPRHFGHGPGFENDTESSNYVSVSSSSSSLSSSLWLSRSSSRRRQQQCSGAAQEVDPFAIPREYKWSSFDDKSRRMKKSKSSRRHN